MYFKAQVGGPREEDLRSYSILRYFIQFYFDFAQQGVGQVPADAHVVKRLTSIDIYSVIIYIFFHWFYLI